MKKGLILFTVTLVGSFPSYSQQKRGAFGACGSINVASQTYYGAEIGLAYLRTVSMDNRANYPVLLVWGSLDVGTDYNWKSNKTFNRGNVNLVFNLNTQTIINPSFGISCGITRFSGRTYVSTSPQIGVCYNNIDVRNPVSINLYYQLNPLIGCKAQLIQEIGVTCYFTVF